MSNTEDHKGELQVYELGYLVLPSIPEDKLPEVVDSIKKVINNAGGQEFDGEEPRKRNLAYSMSKVVGSSKYVVSDAYMGWIKFELPKDVEEKEHPAEVIKKGVESMDEILRILLIKAPRESEFTFAKASEAMREDEASLEDSSENDDSDDSDNDNEDSDSDESSDDE